MVMDWSGSSIVKGKSPRLTVAPRRGRLSGARRGDLSHVEVAVDLDISVESVRRWVRQADVDDGVVGGQTSAEQNELVQLRRDKRRLEMENEILRRAAAYFAAGSLPE